MKMILSALVAMSASIALANPPAHTGHEAAKETKTTATTATTETKTVAKTVDCKDMKNKDKAECKKAAH
ncbi:MAG TPA: hypothetical protein PL182_12900 [Pseudobdellovibrionaceae bacterium]|nr:hypothetical protein [Pseudobdellovibrionaceae bacterium]